MEMWREDELTGYGGAQGALRGLGWRQVSGAGPGHLEDLGHVFRVPLLCDIAQLGRDIDSAADVHVHLHSLFLDLCVQVCHGLQGGQQGYMSEGRSKREGAIRSRENPRGQELVGERVEPFLRVGRGWWTLLRVGRDMGTSGRKM